MIASTQITNTEIFAFIAVLFFKLLQEFESRWMSVELISYVKTIVFYKLYDFFREPNTAFLHEIVIIFSRIY